MTLDRAPRGLLVRKEEMVSIEGSVTRAAVMRAAKKIFEWYEGGERSWELYTDEGQAELCVLAADVLEAAGALKEETMLMMAIIRAPHVALEDHSEEMCVWFDAHVSETRAAMLIVGPSHGAQFWSLWNAMKGDVKNLEGKPCWVATRDGFALFERVCDL